jgi:hypothetical protein
MRTEERGENSEECREKVAATKLQLVVKLSVAARVGELEQTQWLAKKIALRCERSSSLSSSLRLSIISYRLTSEENTKLESRALKFSRGTLDCLTG